MLLRLGIAVGVLLLLYAAYLVWRRPPRRLRALDLSALGVEGPAIIQFTTGFCAPCKLAAPRLLQVAESRRVGYAQLDIGKRPEVASRYRIRTVPTIVVADRRGRVLGVWTSFPANGEIGEAAQRARAR